jgi:hypothetical protein
MFGSFLPPSPTPSLTPPSHPQIKVFIEDYIHNFLLLLSFKKFKFQKLFHIMVSSGLVIIVCSGKSTDIHTSQGNSFTHL